MSKFRWHYINLILKCSCWTLKELQVSVSDTAASILGSALVRLILFKMSTFYPESVKRNQYKWKKEKETYWEQSPWHLPFSALPAGGNFVQSICSFRVSYHEPRHSPIFMWLDFNVLNPHRQSSLKLCPFWLMSNEFSMCFFLIKLNLL